jgi:hypothetical protein
MVETQWHFENNEKIKVEITIHSNFVTLELSTNSQDYAPDRVFKIFLKDLDDIKVISQAIIKAIAKPLDGVKLSEKELDKLVDGIELNRLISEDKQEK